MKWKKKSENEAYLDSIEAYLRGAIGRHQAAGFPVSSLKWGAAPHIVVELRRRIPELPAPVDDAGVVA